MTQQRKLAAVMFTDIIGYTALMSKDEQKALKTLQKNRDLQKSLAEKYTGEFLKEMGDGTLLCFQSALDAVRCAMEIQQSVKDDTDLNLRIGIHLGDIVFKDGDVFGDGVNVASRIERLAESGCICISEEVNKLIRNQPEIKAVFIGEKQLKNVDHPVKIYQIVESVSRRKRIDTPADHSDPIKKSIAVLPFVNMSADPEQEYFCDGMTEEIINALTHIENLKVIARTSAFMFKGKHEDMRSIGKKLDVAHLLEGSIRKAGNRLRITAQLIKVADGSHLWSEKFDREMEDVFAIQDEISLAIVDNLKARLLGSEKKAMLKHHTENSELYNLYLLGRFYTNKRNTEGLNKAIGYFEEAIRKEPNYALPYAGLSEAYTLCAIGYGALPSKEAFPKAKEAALKAIAIDDELAEAHTSFAFAIQYSEPKRSEVETELKKAIELNPGYAPAHQWYGEYLAIQKRWDEAYNEIGYAIELDPLSVAINNELAWFYHYQGKLDLAIKQYKKVMAMDPSYAIVYFNLGTAYVLKGLYEEAIEMSKKAVELSGGSPFMKAGLAYAYAISGKTELAEEIRDELIQLADSGYMVFGSLAVVYAGLKEKERAIKSIEQSFNNMENFWLVSRHCYEDYLGTDLLSDDPRFIEIQNKLGWE